MGRAEARQHEAQRLLGAGLADRARHGDDPGVRAAARGDPKATQGVEHVGRDDKRPGAFELRRPLLRYDRRRRALRKRVAHEGVTVARLAGDGEEKVARLQRARVDRSAGRGLHITGEPRACRCDDLLGSPEGRAHRDETSAMAALITS